MMKMITTIHLKRLDSGRLLPETIGYRLAIFGVNLKYNFPFICAMIGSGIASAFSVMTSSTANSIGVGGLPGILSMQPQSMGTFAIAMLIAIAVPFVLTVIIGKRKNIA